MDSNLRESIFTSSTNLTENKAPTFVTKLELSVRDKVGKGLIKYFSFVGNLPKICPYLEQSYYFYCLQLLLYIQGTCAVLYHLTF